MAIQREQITDWATDYDIFDPIYVKDPYPLWQDLRERCPIAHSDRWGGSWLPTRYKDVFAIAQDWQTFSSTEVTVVPAAVLGEDDPDYGVKAPPITSDPPEHTWARRLLLPQFSARAIERWEPHTRELAHSLIDGFIQEGRADAAHDYAQQIPPRVIAEMLGIPPEMSDTFVDWVRGVLELGLQDPELRSQSRAKIIAFFREQMAERRENPKEDLVSYLVQAEVEGEPVSDLHILGTCLLLLLAGIDTTWSSIGSALWHLAQNPEDRARLINEPEIINHAVEELLRAYSPVTMARIVTQDTESHGCPMSKGDRVLMNFPSANRDPEVFADPDAVMIDRKKNPHIAFGVGIHRCLGSNLARMEMKVAIQEWLARIPDFELKNPDAVTWAGGQVRGPRSLPVVWKR